MVGSIIAGVVSIAEAIPALDRILEKIIELKISRSIDRINAQSITVKDKRMTLMKSIERAKTNEERKALSIILADMVNGKLPNS